MSCEGACLRGEVSRRAANILCNSIAPDRTVRICLGCAFTKDAGQRALVRNAAKVVAIEGCFLQLLISNEPRIAPTVNARPGPSTPAHGRRPGSRARDAGGALAARWNHRHRFHLEQEFGPHQPHHLHEGAGRQDLAEVPVSNLAKSLELRDVGHEDRHLRDIVEGRPSGGQRYVEVLEHLRRLRPEVPCADEVSFGVDSNLARDVERTGRRLLQRRACNRSEPRGPRD